MNEIANKCFQAMVDIYSGRMSTVTEVPGQSLGQGYDVVTHDQGSSLQIHVMAADLESAEAAIKAEYERYCSMPIVNLNKEYGRHADQQQRQ